MTNDDNSTTSSSKKLPPGMIIGPDGKPCKICTAFRNWRPPATATATKEKRQNSAYTSTAAVMGALASGSFTSQSASRPDTPPPNCPPDVEQLGRATWTFLHTTAAYYPEQPTTVQRANMLMLIRSLPALYPCRNCADDFEQNVEAHPPDVSSRERLSRWLCERHNDVNDRLGKSRFDCAKTDERWRDGPVDGSCD